MSLIWWFHIDPVILPHPVVLALALRARAKTTILHQITGPIWNHPINNIIILSESIVHTYCLGIEELHISVHVIYVRRWQLLENSFSLHHIYSVNHQKTHTHTQTRTDHTNITNHMRIIRSEETKNCLLYKNCADVVQDFFCGYLAYFGNVVQVSYKCLVKRCLF